MSRIESLTGEQTALLPEFREKWIARALQTGACDRTAMEEAVAKVYQSIGLPPPTTVIWLDSPLAGALVACRLSMLPKEIVGEQFQVNGSHWSPIWSYGFSDETARIVTLPIIARKAAPRMCVGRGDTQILPFANVDSQNVWQPLTKIVNEPIREQAWNQIGEQIRRRAATDVAEIIKTPVARAFAKFRTKLETQVQRQVSDQMYRRIASIAGQADTKHSIQARVATKCANLQVGVGMHGQHDAGELAFYEVLAGVCGIDVGRRLEGLMSLADGGWWWSFRNAVILTERPTQLLLDSNGRLHSSEGPAIRYPDGWSIYAVHGVQVPKHVVAQKITLAGIERESNAEVRRVMIERYGTGRYLLDSGAKIVHRDASGILYRKDIDKDEPVVMVRVLNSTPEPDGSLSRGKAIVTFGEAAKWAQLSPEGTRWKEYMVRVPPTMQTATEAVAWTFGLSSKDYAPYFET